MRARHMRGLLALAAVLVTLVAAPAAAQTGEVIADIRVHGNHVTTNDEILTIAGVAVGTPVEATTIAQVEDRLRRSGKFKTVEVLKRYASIADPTRISLIIIVNEGPVRIEFNEEGGEEVASIVRRRGLRNVMWLPILDAEDGYGVTYGIRPSYVGLFGARSRVSVPLSWGGTKRAAVEVDTAFTSGPITRLQVGAGVQRRKNPAFDINDDRRQVWGRAERAWSYFRVGASAGWDRVTFGAIKDEFVTLGGDVAVDTRLDPGYPRNAVWVRASWHHLRFDAGQTLQRTNIDARGYLGLIGQSVLAVRGVRSGANGPQPRYLQPLLGGWSNLRGFEAGQFHGDIVVSGSAELFVPLSSPMNVGKLGISAFVDTGVAYDHGLKFGDQKRHTGIGGSLWMTATVFKLSLSVAHGRGGSTRINFGGGVTF